MLKKSTTNDPAPLLKEISARGKGMPSEPVRAAAKTGGKTPANTVGLVEIKPKGNTTSTFRAPRRGDSCSPMECGYTKLGKA